MISYKELTKYFGTSLFDISFKRFLSSTFSQLTEYNIIESHYIISEDTGIELGFTNNDAIYDDDEQVVFEPGTPIFSHFNIYPRSTTLIKNLPYNVDFSDNRSEIIKKAGMPTQTKQGHLDLMDKNYLIDNYLFDDIVTSFDYLNIDTLSLIQIRSNKLVTHLRL